MGDCERVTVNERKKERERDIHTSSLNCRFYAYKFQPRFRNPDGTGRGSELSRVPRPRGEENFLITETHTCPFGSGRGPGPGSIIGCDCSPLPRHSPSQVQVLFTYEFQRFPFLKNIVATRDEELFRVYVCKNHKA